MRRALLDAVDFAVGVNPRTGRERAPRVRAWAELQLAPGGDVVARAEISKEARERMAAAIPSDKASPTAAVARRALVRRAPTRAALRGVAVLPSLTPTPGFDLVSSNRVGGDKNPGFKGDVLDKSDGLSYLNAIHQYAVSSYSRQVVQARMTPRFVAVPEDATDVALAINFAAKHGLKVVTRSGGHQYCGLSSGGGDTLLIDMRLFKKVAFSGGSPSTGAPTQVTVGPGVALRDASKHLRDNGLVIPHGECPLVNLGGHVQTGGIGHQLREVTFELVSDNEYPDSAGCSYPYPYLRGATKEGFRVAIEHFRQWADRQSRGLLPPGIDLFLTVVSGDFPRPSALLVETMCKDKAGLPEIKAVVDAIDAAVPWWVRAAAHIASPVKGAESLSVIADEGVRKIGVTGLPKSGREFDLPYKKSLHITTTPFSKAFRDRFQRRSRRAHALGLVRGQGHERRATRHESDGDPGPLLRLRCRVRAIAADQEVHRPQAPLPHVLHRASSSQDG